MWTKKVFAVSVMLLISSQAFAHTNDQVVENANREAAKRTGKSHLVAGSNADLVNIGQI